MEEQYVSFNNNCTDLTVKYHAFTVGYKFPSRDPNRTFSGGASNRNAQNTKCFWASGSDMNFDLLRQAPTATLLGLAGPSIQISHTTPHCLSMWVLSAPGISSVHLFWHSEATKGIYF